MKNNTEPPVRPSAVIIPSTNIGTPIYVINVGSKLVKNHIIRLISVANTVYIVCPIIINIAPTAIFLLILVSILMLSIKYIN